MAQAQITPAVTRTETVVVTPERVDIQLSLDEAAALLAVAGRLSGPFPRPLQSLYEQLLPILEGRGLHRDYDVVSHSNTRPVIGLVKKGERW